MIFDTSMGSLGQLGSPGSVDFGFPETPQRSFWANARVMTTSDQIGCGGGEPQEVVLGTG